LVALHRQPLVQSVVSFFQFSNTQFLFDLTNFSFMKKKKTIPF
jgi:hypothetical protein